MLYRKCTIIINVEKTVCVTFGNYIDRIPKSMEINIENEVLKRVNEVTQSIKSSQSPNKIPAGHFPKVYLQ